MNTTISPLFDLKKIDRSNRLESIKNTVMKISPKRRVFDKACEIADLVLSKEEKYAAMSDVELKNMSYRIMDEIREKQTSIDNYLVDGLAIAREMIFRVHGLKAFRVQIIGAIVVHFGDFAEMATGEGKTLALLLVSYVNALTKKGVHIVTVNEYLVERDANFSKEALTKLGISVGYVTSSMDHAIKKQMYDCDITYVSNSELGFDYLRDNMVTDASEKLLRPLYFAIVDEADSVLIDEARTPLIIAGAPQEDVSQYIDADNFVKQLNPSDYIIDLESQAINLNDSGIKKAEEFFKIKNLYDIQNSEIVHKVMNALRANYMMEIEREYIIKRNPKKGTQEIALIDAFTGRILEGRMYSAGLHQAIQAKERVPIEPENLTVATITYQSFFRLYKKLSGVSGTALTEKNELLNIYNMVVVDIPTNKPKKRIDHPDYIFATKQLKWKYIVADIKKRHATGQPILVGTVSVDDSELLHKMLDKIGIEHNVLNAKKHAEEAKIIANAGQRGAVTIATNMAGRGTDIKLGPGVEELGGLYVLGTERNESRRIDNQLRGRSGRQGDPGESRFFISLQDLIFKRFATDFFDKAQYKLGEEVIDLKFFSRLLNKTQKRVENMNFDIRKNLIDYDYVLSEQRELFYKQRDAVLTSDNIIEIVFRMIPRIVDVLLILNRNQENIDMIDVHELVIDIESRCGIKLKVDEEALSKKTVSEIFDFFTNEIRLLVYKKYKQLTKPIANQLWRNIIISSMDANWTKFLDKIQKLRDSVTLRSFEQKSPLNIYVEDSDRLFYNIIINIASETIFGILGFDDENKKNIATRNETSPRKPVDIFDAFTTGNQIVLPSDNSYELNSKSNHTIDDLSLSQSITKEVKENDTINSNFVGDNKNKESIIMSSSNSDKINNVVDEILGLSKKQSINQEPDKNSKQILDQIMTGYTEPNINSNETKTTPPPIPSSPKVSQGVSNTTNQPTSSLPPIGEQPRTNKPGPTQQSSNNFMDQVLNIVNSDIKPKQVDIDYDGIAGTQKANKPSSKPENVPPTASKPIQTNVINDAKPNPTINQNNKPFETFTRDDHDKIDNYTFTKKPTKQLLNEDELNKRIQNKEKQLDQRTQDLLNNAKDEEIRNLRKEIDDINNRLVQKQIEQEQEIAKLVSNENSELKEIHEMLLNAIKEQDAFYKEQQNQIRELKEHEARALMEEEIRRKIENEQQEKLMAERKKIEEERLALLEKEKALIQQQEEIERSYEELANYDDNDYYYEDEEYDDIVDPYMIHTNEQEVNQQVNNNQLYNKQGIPLRPVPTMKQNNQLPPTMKVNQPVRRNNTNKVPTMLSNSYINRVNNSPYDDDDTVASIRRR